MDVSVEGAGAAVFGGTAGLEFVHGTGQVPSDIVVEWDFDNDGDFDQPVEDITEFVLAVETRTGRDWPSLLTGKAAPGQLRATLRNDDDRFSFFNTASPLNTAGNTLKTGRKLRIRTTTAANPDPVLLARDRFRRANGALGNAETGQAWSQPLADDLTITSQEAIATGEGNEHIAVVDVGTADYYAQVKLAEVGAETTGLTGNVVGLVYRWQDSSNYSLAVLDVDAAQLQLIDVVAGTPTAAATEPVEVYDHMTVGVLLAGAAVTLYLEGVPLLTDTAVQTDETEVGIYASWATGQPAPALDDFWVWDGLPAEVEGILWTGDVSDLNSDVQAGPLKLAMLGGKGWLSRPAGQKVRPPASVTGRPTGLLVGNTLAMTNLLHPPGPLAEGDITTGSFGMPDIDAIEAVRRFEETELGFLYETQEGPIGFAARTARDVTSPLVGFTDAPGGQFGYHRLTPFDWRREIVNRVLAGVTPSVPSGVTLTRGTQSIFNNANPLQITMPATVTQGDLLLVIVSAVTGSAAAAANFGAPQNWMKLASSGESIATTGTLLIFAKVADGNEDSSTITFGTSESLVTSGSAAWHIYRVTDWFGSIQDGVQVGDYTPGNDPGAVFPPWDFAPSLFLAVRQGVDGTASISGTTYPLGYTDGASDNASGSGSDASGIQSARRLAVTQVENPGSFGGTFSGFTEVASTVVAVRGPNADSDGRPIRGQVEVQVDDLDSQDEHNAIRTHRNPANLFATEADAQTYGELVLARHADSRPIVAISFWATKTAAYRNQAIRRRVSDRMTLIAENNAGMGINGDFFIETIGHRWSQGLTLWEVTWELSPVA